MANKVSLEDFLMALHVLSDGAVYSQQIAPQSITGDGAYHEAAGARVAAGSFETVQFLIELGALVAADTVDVKVIQANAASAGTSKDLTNAALAQVATAGANLLYSIEVNLLMCDVANGFLWVNVSYSIANTKASLISCTAIGYGARKLPTVNGLTQAVKVLA